MRDHVLFMKDINSNSGWFVDLELDDDELRALGMVAAQWAFLEHTIRDHAKHMATLIGCDLPREITSDSLRKQKQSWEALSRQALADLPEHLSAVLALVERVGNLEGDRNTLIHGVIEWDEKNPNSLNFHSKKNPRGGPRRFDVKRIEDFAKKVATLNYDFLAVHGPPEFVFGASLRRPGTPVSSGPHQILDPAILATLTGSKTPKPSSEG